MENSQYATQWPIQICLVMPHFRLFQAYRHMMLYGFSFWLKLTERAPYRSYRRDLHKRRKYRVARIEEMRSRVAAMVKQFPSFDSDVAVYANPQFFQTALDAFNELTDKQRRIDARLVSRTGDLVKNYDNVDIVGKGSYSVQLRDGNSLSGWGTHT